MPSKDVRRYSSVKVPCPAWCRFQLHKAVTECPHIRFYAAAPIVSSGGQRLGAL